MAYTALVRSKLEYSASVWDPHLKQDIDKLERVQRQAARFISGDYRSRDPGCVTAMLKEQNLPVLEERRRHQRLNLFYKITEDLLPALPKEKFLTPMDNNRRKIKPTRHQGFQSANIVERHTANHSRGFRVPYTRTEQYRSSFFVRTTEDWKMLSEKVVNAATPSAFASALAGAGHPSPN